MNTFLCVCVICEFLMTFFINAEHTVCNIQFLNEVKLAENVTNLRVTS